ncbi:MULTISPECIES: epoxide hydrolase family protein [Methanoculleus]|uniref:Epoxide hydrolase domain protein n=2 Tax=Methanoculleus TaxID=45989 RepID=A3CUF8_METMJ|nr:MULTISPECIES: epoxide hydrolase family protein [Methanoculleus]ABN57008.1 Epoxide hydrolase domain protein [Methanoculleus marisnigri JR1]MCC7555574.1 epoxide hydrolase [Methanoculleus marisnigri]UYU18427.1 epoxide hydrolase [Methanoculleus submarinus]
MQPFTIAVPEAVLDDLRQRLARTRWPDDGGGRGYGIDLAYMKDLARYWEHSYDWRRHEAYLNRFAQFRTEVDGVGIHFVHERGRGPDPTPLLLLHGWPDSFYRYHRVIPMLADPARFGGDPDLSFDVVVPSIPGHGFSDRKPMTTDDTADLFAGLMTEELGYGKFVAAGGDAGTLIAQALAERHADALVGIHLTDVGYPDQTTDFSTLTEPEMAFANYIREWWMNEGAFNIIQSTKPQSLAYGLADSPAGLAAWIMSFMVSGTTGEEFETRIGRDELLTNITIYWVTRTIGSSVRRYYLDAHAILGPWRRTPVPAAVAHPPRDAPLPREWAERRVNLRHFTELPRGGHFAAWEEPELYAKDVLDFVGELRNS